MVGLIVTRQRLAARQVMHLESAPLYLAHGWQDMPPDVTRKMTLAITHPQQNPVFIENDVGITMSLASPMIGNGEHVSTIYRDD